MIEAIILVCVVLGTLVAGFSAYFSFMILKELRKPQDYLVNEIARQAMADSLASAGHRNKLGKAVLKVIKPDHDD